MTEVAYTPEAAKILSRLDRQTARRIREYMGEVGRLDDPRSRGKGLAGNLGGLWRYRIGVNARRFSAEHIFTFALG